MSRYTLRPKAERDLFDHEDYLAENASPETAARFVDAFESSVLLLATHPEMGVLREYRRPELAGQRMFPVSDFENYLIFYMPRRDVVEVTRVIYAKRNIRALCA